MPTRGGLFCNRPCPPAYILSSGIGSLGRNGLIDPPCPAQYHNRMLDNQLEKGFELKGRMMGSRGFDTMATWQSKHCWQVPDAKC